MARGNLIQWRGAVAAAVALAALLWSAYHGIERLTPLWQSTPGYASLEAGGPDPGTESSPQYDISDIVEAHLFGTAAEPVPDTVVEAPETRLQLDLLGLIASADQRLARAIIRVNGSRVQPYAIGDAIDGTDAAIHSVESRRVLLQRDGALESLALKRQSVFDSNSVTFNTGSQVPTPDAADNETGDAPQNRGFGEPITGDRIKLPF